MTSPLTPDSMAQESRAERRRRLARERMRRRRERERRGIRRVVFEIRPERVSGLIDMGALAMSEIEDDDALQRALDDLWERAIEEAKLDEHNQKTGDGPMMTRCARVRVDRG